VSHGQRAKRGSRGAKKIAVFNDPARLASRYSTTASELRTTGGGTPETDGRAR
jgi:hypothetical protein